MGVHAFSDNHNFWQSDPLLHTREFVSKLHDFANENVANYMDKLGYIYEEFYTTQCWSNVYEKTRSIHPHRHYNSFLSWILCFNFYPDLLNTLRENKYGYLLIQLKTCVTNNQDYLFFSRFISTPNAVRTSADPDLEVIDLLPCFAT